jgi:hypothetical protein
MATGLVTGLAVGTIVVGVPLSWFAVDIGGSAKLWHIWVGDRHRLPGRRRRGPGPEQAQAAIGRKTGLMC